MKKIASIVLSSLLLLTTAGLASAQSPESIKPDAGFKVTFSKSEIKDLDTLYQKAKNRISDEKVALPKVELKNNQTNEVVDLESLSTTQLLEVKEDKTSNSTVKRYVTTAFATPYAAGGSGEKPKNAWDSSYAVNAFSTIYWNITVSGGLEYISLTEVKGGWTVGDSKISLDNRLVRIGQTGTTKDRSHADQKEEHYNYELLNNKFDYGINSNWVPVRTSQSYTLVGVYTEVKLYRGTSSWELTLSNNYN
ncbi:hypothetical protein [Paenibacillus oleatilyticus]|uniref:hypothetical protein n=1 Tax=Paenibacillus oleatilyticus TaxID=2594886 RepID=UPI001C1FD5CD|nr:hypothetical protein [Paenibacillus oleatilyticus]MBU7314267.1 hypothetical protein [Paenibacillus oleatilyticus]